MRDLRGRRDPGIPWLSFEEIRARQKVRPGTPSLKRPAKTFAPGLPYKSRESREAMWDKQTKRNASEPELG